MKWAVELQHYSLDKRSLVDLLRALGLYFLEPPHERLFTSSCIETMSSAQDVWAEANRICNAFCGSSDVDPTFQLGSVVDVSSGYHAYTFVELTGQVACIATATGTLTVNAATRTQEEREQERQRQEEVAYQSKLKTLRARLVSSYRHPNAERVMALVRSIPQTGETLYKSYELMEGHPSNRRAFQLKFGISNADFKRFGDAVHNPVVSGDLARHAYDDAPKTANPMNIREATCFVKALTDKWLASISLDTQTEP